MTEQHTAETDYAEQYTPHDNGQYHHAPPQADIPAPFKPTLKLSEPSPRPSRAWPLTARLAVAVLIIALAAVAGGSLWGLSRVSDKQTGTDRQVSQLSRAVGLSASQASQDNSATGGSVSSLRSQLGSVQAQVSAIAAAVRLQGLCLRVWTDNNGHVSAVVINPPVISNGNPGCPAGLFVSVVPAP